MLWILQTAFHLKPVLCLPGNACEIAAFLSCFISSPAAIPNSHRYTCYKPASQEKPMVPTRVLTPFQPAPKCRGSRWRLFKSLASCSFPYLPRWRHTGRPAVDQGDLSFRSTHIRKAVSLSSLSQAWLPSDLVRRLWRIGSGRCRSGRRLRLALANEGGCRK